MADGVEIEQLILGRVHPQVDTDKMFERILLGITDSCQNCEIIEKKIYKNLPNQFDGVFENKQVGLTYVSVDTEVNTIGDVRYIFPNIEPQLTCEDLAEYIKFKTEQTKQYGTVSCVDAAK